MGVEDINHKVATAKGNYTDGIEKSQTARKQVSELAGIFGSLLAALEPFRNIDYQGKMELAYTQTTEVVDAYELGAEGLHQAATGARESAIGKLASKVLSHYQSFGATQENPHPLSLELQLRVTAVVEDLPALLEEIEIGHRAAQSLETFLASSAMEASTLVDDMSKFKLG